MTLSLAEQTLRNLNQFTEQQRIEQAASAPAPNVAPFARYSRAELEGMLSDLRENLEWVRACRRCEETKQRLSHAITERITYLESRIATYG